MAGFLPVGSFPVASVPGGVGGASYSPITVTVVYEAGLAASVSGISPFYVYQTIRETLRSTETTLKVNALIRETLRSSTEGDTKILVRAIVRETLRNSMFGDTGVDVRSLVREVLRSAGLVSTGRRRQLILPNVGPWL